MKKGLLLSLLAMILIGATVFAVWYINERGRMDSYSKDAFIPYNSAVVISVNDNARLSQKIQDAFADDIRKFSDKLLSKVVDTLIQQGYALTTSKVLAMRMEGKNDLAFLYVMDNRDVLSRGEIAEFLKQVFPGSTDKIRKYDRHKIYSLKKGEEEIFYCIGDGMILVSDSELYVEDGLKQFDQEMTGGAGKTKFQNVNKYFSAGAGINIFMNSGCFSDLLPMFLEIGNITPNLDITKCFKWGALDGDVNEKGICLNGFMHYDGLDASYMQTLEGQQPREGVLDGVIPSQAVSFTMLNLSHTDAYLSALEQYRYNAGLKDQVFKRKQQLAQLFGTEVETELKGLLQGEFAIVNLSFNESRKEKDGLTIVYLKSGSLCRALIEKMLGVCAKVNNTHPDNYRKSYSIDRDKSFRYYQFPEEDLAAVYWGYIFEGIKNRYVLIEDNYLVFASSEEAVKSFVKDYVHRSFIKDTEWYKNLRTKLSVKYNLSYFANVTSALPFYKHIAKGTWREYIHSNDQKLSLFSTLALQWSNEGNMLYNTLYVNTEKVQDTVRPFILWQTKLESRMSMKPVPVLNHVTGERELFVQDDHHTVYLINDAGRVLWKQLVDGPINSTVYQVDLFKNGKLQYLFSTPSKLYLIDRNGNAAGHFPVTFPSSCSNGITMYDYDNDRNYRIFAPCEDRKIYLYGLDGDLVKGWDSSSADKEIVSKVQYYRVGDKDYLVYADRYRFYILDRKGCERVKVSSVFDLRDHTDIYLTRKGEQFVLAFANANGPVNWVDFKGNVQTVKCGSLSPDYHMNVADVNGDGQDDYVFTDADRLFVYSASGQLLYEKELEAHSLDFPYVYQFSGADIRIGLIDREQKRMLLLSPDGTISKGFPINGDSPFSIVFSGEDGFFLFAGADDGMLIKYKVER